jgi:F0F1-type ATP synthase membrane subunit c/vacuolar-type H+-ATPase subunit K
MEVIFEILGALIFIALGWVLPIWLGLRAARRNNRSGLWMWFGFHPIGGWIAFAVLTSLPALKTCTQCGEKAKSHAKICPYCMTQFDEQTLSSLPNGAKAQAVIPNQEKSLRMTLLVARIIVSLICFAAVAMYTLVFSIAVLQNELSKFAIGFSKVPYTQPALVTLLVVSIFTFVAVLVAKYLYYTKARPKPSSVPSLNLVFAIVAAALMETIGIYGLVLGFMFGPDVASLTLTMLLVTVLGGVIIFPRQQAWQSRYERSLSPMVK